jgi:ribose-phosphate pyrophosphokinase
MGFYKNTIAILDLSEPECSDISYQISRFPDGQQNIKLIPKGNEPLGVLPHYAKVAIKSRFNSFLDLELIIAATRALRGLRCKNITLYVPYLLGARSDRQFQPGESSYLRDVIAPIINDLNFDQVVCYDVHSHVASAVIPNLVNSENHHLVRKSIEAICSAENISESQLVLVAPDAGAQHKVFDLVKKLKFSGSLVTCSKERDLQTGQIVRTHIENKELIPHTSSRQYFVVVDDICDGGRTFINISQALRKEFPRSKIYLVVSHGIFSNGLKPMEEHFDGLFCTDSIRSSAEFERIFLNNKSSFNNPVIHKIQIRQ